MLAQIQAETQTALEDLRDLARGIYPPLLVDKGLVAALEAQARKSPVPVDVGCRTAVGRYPPTSRPPSTSRVSRRCRTSPSTRRRARTVIRAQSNGDLTFEVVDDGRGFDPAERATEPVCRGSPTGSTRSAAPSRSGEDIGAGRPWRVACP